MDPWVWSLKVLYICYGHCHASGAERLPERHRPPTQTRAKTRDTNPGTTKRMNLLCAAGTDVLLPAQITKKKSFSACPGQSSLKTLFQHGELTKLKSRSNFYYGKSHVASRRRSLSIERDHECSCYPVEDLLTIYGIVLLCVEHLVFCFFPFLNNCKACCKDLPFL